MKQFMLLFYANEKVALSLPKEQMDEGIAKLTAYAEALGKAGILDAGNALARSFDAATVSNVDGELKVHNGPYADTHEQLGGYMIIKADDMAAACAWAKKCPAATWGHVEVRPLHAS